MGKWHSARRRLSIVHVWGEYLGFLFYLLFKWFLGVLMVLLTLNVAQLVGGGYCCRSERRCKAIGCLSSKKICGDTASCGILATHVWDGYLSSCLPILFPGPSCAVVMLSLLNWRFCSSSRLCDNQRKETILWRVSQRIEGLYFVHFAPAKSSVKHWSPRIPQSLQRHRKSGINSSTFGPPVL